MLQSELSNGCAQLETDVNSESKLQAKFGSKRKNELVFGVCDKVSILSLQLVLVGWDRAKKPMA